jgi:hypothetical protein
MGLARMLGNFGVDDCFFRHGMRIQEHGKLLNDAFGAHAILRTRLREQRLDLAVLFENVLGKRLVDGKLFELMARLHPLFFSGSRRDGRSDTVKK